MIILFFLKRTKFYNCIDQSKNLKEKKMNGERKLNDASEIAKSKEQVDDSLKTAMNETVRHVPVPTIPGSWDTMDPNVCQGLGQKLDYQGKIILMIIYHLLILVHKIMLMKNN